MHSIDYRNPSQLREGDVLIVGAGNSGADIGLDLARSHRTWLSGRDIGHVPINIDGPAARFVLPILFRVVFHRVLTLNTPIGRKKRSELISEPRPLVRVKPKDIAAAGIERVPRTVGVRDGLPLLEDGRVLDVANVIWCTGYQANFSWIDLPDFEEGEPKQWRGVVAGEPGLYFVGLDFLYAASSSMIQGVSRDAAYVANHIASAVRAERPYPETRTADMTA
jgi:putative flavoprotein involved in K+ transport